VIAKSGEGKEIYRDSKTYMPHPARFGSRSLMGRGPYEKSGMIRDTSLPPLRTVHESYEIAFPYQDVKQGNGSLRKLLSDFIDVEVRLLYLPFGERDQEHFIWNIEKRRLRIAPNEESE